MVNVSCCSNSHKEMARRPLINILGNKYFPNIPVFLYCELSGWQIDWIRYVGASFLRFWDKLFTWQWILCNVRSTVDIVGQPLSLGTFNIFNCCPLSRGGETTSNKTVITDLNIMTLCTESVRAYSSPWVSIGAGRIYEAGHSSVHPCVQGTTSLTHSTVQISNIYQGKTGRQSS